MPLPAAKGIVKKLFSVVTLYCLLLAQSVMFSPVADAQVGNVIAQPTRSAGKFFAASYGRYVLHTVSNTAAGAGSIQVDVGLPTVNGSVNVSDSRFLNVFQAPFPPLLVDQGTPQESVTPTGVANCNSPYSNNLSTGNVPICTVSGTFNNAHGANANVISGSLGAQEAVNDAQASGGGVVVLDQAWQALVAGQNLNANTIIAALVPFQSVVIEDDRGPAPVFLAPRATGTTALASGSAPVLTITGTGGLTSGAYRVEYQYVDAMGQLGTTSTESAQTGTTTIVNFSAAPAASTGAVGYVVNLTAAAGGANSETNFPLTSANCTLTKIETIIPACALTNTTYGQTGSAFTSGASANNATSTFKGIGAGTATDTSSITRTVYAYQPVGYNFPAQVVNLVAGATTQAAGTGTYEVASWNLPANFFNFVGRRYKLHFDGHYTSAANSGTVTVNAYYGPYNNSDTKLVAVVGTAVSGTTQALLSGDVMLIPTATGATGAISANGWMAQELAASSATTFFGSVTAVSNTSLPLSTGQQLRFEVVVGAGALGSAITFDDITLEPAN